MRPSLDRAAFIRPHAHRGLHDASQGIIENTKPAFDAAIAMGCGIECDLRPARGGEPMVFHDLDIGRLMDADGLITDFAPPQLRRLRYRGSIDQIMTFAALLDLVAGKVPLMVEIKGEWTTPDIEFLARIAALARGYDGPIALKSFEPELMKILRRFAPEVPRGIVAGKYSGKQWWPGQLSAVRRYCLRHLICCAPAAPSFISYHIKDLPALAPWIARNLFKLPLFTWTVRTSADRAAAAKWADAPIFEGSLPRITAKREIGVGDQDLKRIKT